MTARLSTEAPTDPRESSRKPAPLVFWSAFGIVVTLLAVFAWTGWIGSDGFARAEPGPDHYRFLWYLRTFEVASVFITAGMIWGFVIRPWRRG